MTPRLALAIALPATALLIACGGGGTSSDSRTIQTAAESPSPSPAQVVPAPDDFALTVKTTKKECFGSAGCNVTFRIDVAYFGEPPSPDDEWLITYQISGGEDGPTVNSFTMRGQELSFASEDFLSVKTAKTVITAKVTDVAPN